MTPANQPPGRISRFVSCIEGGNIIVFSIVMAAALLVTGARVLAPFEVGKDQGSQLEAAQRLVDGLGLTTTNDVPPVSYDIVEAPNAKYLTWWPPGFSVLVAAFLFVGLPLLASLKILYALTTLAGWFAWGALVSRFVSEGIKIGGRTYPFHLLVFILPILFTPKWSGTDVFLWAGVPIIILVLFKAGHTKSSKASLLLVGVAGLLFGSLYSIRYASLFMGAAMGLMLVQISLPNLKLLVMRCLVFGLSAASIMLPVFLYAKVYSTQGSGLPSYIMTGYTANMVSDASIVLLRRLPTIANLIFGIPLFDQILSKLGVRWLSYTIGLLCLAVIALLPFIIWRNSLRAGRRPGDDLALSLSILPITLVASIVMVNVYFLGVRRYYEPIALCCVLIGYEIASRRIAHRFVTAASYVILVGFSLYTFIYMPALVFVPARSGYVFQSVLGFFPPKGQRYRSTSRELSYPAHDQMFSQKENSRLKVVDLYEANPEAMFFIEEYGFFIYDRFQHGGPELGKDVRVYPRPRFWEQAYTSKPVKIFWVVNEGTRLNFVPSSNLRLVYTDPYEKTKILESEFPEGYRFFSGDLATRVQQIASPTDHSPAEKGSREQASKPSTNSN
jgi:hypothetical protein